MEAQKKQKGKLVPKLRFKGFDGEWEKCTLGDLAEKRALKNRDNLVNDVFTNSATRGIINQRDYFDKDIANQNNLFNYFVVEKDDFIYNPRISVSAPVGPISRNHIGTGVMSPLYSVFRFHKGNLNFYEIYFSTSKWYEYMEGIANYGARADRMNITSSNFYLMPLPFPTLPEQQKISSFLSSVDEKLTQLTRKKELLAQYKKGVMQQLFSGKLRFKDENGKEYPKWEEKRLGEISKIYDGTHQTPKYVTEGIPFYSVEQVTGNKFSDTKFISREVFEKENLKVRLEKGDILMTKIGDIGTSKLIDWDVEASFYVSLALIKQSKFFNSSFLNQYISSRNFQLELWKRIIHVAFPKKINLGEIGNCMVLLPCLPEQQKIASFLSSIDTKIESITTQISQTQSFKKGLLQQMFV